jgi:GDPmannose 4,6-dehydratase
MKNTRESMPKRAIITGATGQDGSYLAELLLEKEYEVWCIIPRRNFYDLNDQTTLGKLAHISTQAFKKLHFLWGDVTDTLSIEQAVLKVQPHEFYNLAAQSHVRISYDMPLATTETNATAVAAILEVLRTQSPSTKFYQASTSEMFGNSTKNVILIEDSNNVLLQDENTPFAPASPYAVSKVFAHYTTQMYRRAFNLYTCSGILFNHESPRRGHNFVTSKIIRGALAIRAGKLDKLELGNLDSYRDWGHAKDYVEAMWLMIQQDRPDDYVIAMGESRSVRELCKYVFEKVGLGNYEDYVIINPEFYRAEDVRRLCGDSSKARKVLGWSPKYTFEDMIDEMIVVYSNEGNL